MTDQSLCRQCLEWSTDANNKASDRAYGGAGADNKASGRAYSGADADNKASGRAYGGAGAGST